MYEDGIVGLEMVFFSFLFSDEELSLRHGGDFGVICTPAIVSVDCTCVLPHALN